jgi:hypothetical protein
MDDELAACRCTPGNSLFPMKFSVCAISSAGYWPSPLTSRWIVLGTSGLLLCWTDTDPFCLFVVCHQSFLISLIPVAPVLAAVATITLTVQTGGNIKAGDVFAVVAMYNLARFSLSTVPRAVRVRVVP